MISVAAHDNPNYKADQASQYEEIDENSLEQLANIVVGQKAWSPNCWVDGKRSEKNFMTSAYIAIDVDEGLSLVEAVDILERGNFQYLIATTRHHGIEKPKGKSGEMKPACDRYRIVIPTDKMTMSLEDYRETMNTWTQLFKADRCIDGARFFWPSKEIYAVNMEGTVATWIAERAKQRNGAKKDSNVRRLIPQKIADILANTRLQNPSRHMSLFGACAELYRRGFNLCEIEDIVLDSALGQELIGEDGRDEILRHVANAQKRALEDG